MRRNKPASRDADDEYYIGTESSEDAVVPGENLAPIGNKKKSKQGSSKRTGQKDKDADAMDVKKKNSEDEDSGKNNTKSVVNREKNRKEQKLDDHSVQNGQNLRSPICCVMGHLDTGKTKLLDYIRGTNVQEGEAGGITQQIGVSYIPTENIRERTRELNADARLNVPGLLVIDTPGDEPFTDLRYQGSGLCDIAILVVDIVHGVEPQTIESLNILKMKKIDFIVALNKVDRIYGWKPFFDAPIEQALSQQNRDVVILFNERLEKVKNQLQEQGLNTELYYKNKEMRGTCNIVPTSAISGEGIPDLLFLLVQLTQSTMIERLTYSDEVQGTYLHHKEIKSAMGIKSIKISAQGLEQTVAGTSLYVVGSHDDLQDIKEATTYMKSVMSRIDRSGEGVYVQASTLGSLDALLEFLKSPAVNIPVSGTSIGPVHKKDVMKASVMLEKKKEYGTILAFAVKVTQEARELADDLGVNILTANIIYHLFDQFKAYIDNVKEEQKEEAADGNHKFM